MCGAETYNRELTDAVDPVQVLDERDLKVCRDDDIIDELNGQLFRELLSFMMEDPKTVTRSIRLLIISKYFERIADHATNIAEMVVFMVKGKSIRHLDQVPPSV